MGLNNRRKKILSDLLLTEYRPTLDELAQIYQITPRQIRNDIKIMNEELSSKGITSIALQKNGRLDFRLNEQNEKTALSFAQELLDYDPKQLLPKKQRINAALSQLFLAEEYITTLKLSELIDVSRGTIMNDLPAIREWLRGHDLSLKSIQQYGLSLQGSEWNIRKGYVSLLRESLSPSQYTEILMHCSDTSNKFPYLMYQKLSIYILTSESISEQIQTELKVVFSTVSYMDIIIAIAYSRYRRQYKCKITIPEHNTSDLLLYKKIKNSMNFDEGDWRFIEYYILAADILKSNHTYKRKDVSQDMLLTNLISSIGSDLNINLAGNQLLYESLKQDVSPALFRTENKMTVQNPYMDKINRSYPDIFQAVKKHVTPLEIFVGHEFSDEEIGFLTIHFIAAVEESRSLQMRVVVLCGLGVGSANLLVKRLSQTFHLEIVAVAAASTVKSVAANESIDFIISTVPIEEEELPVVLVSPFLTEQDIGKIQVLINRLGKEKLPKDETKMTIPGLGLLDVLTTDTIDLECDATDFLDAITKAGELLEKSEKTEKPYTSSMVKTVKEIGPYIVFSKGIALPHSNEVQYVKKMGVSMIRLKTPVYSGHPFNDPVSFLIAFASPDGQGHVRAMMDLGELIYHNVFDQIQVLDSAEDVLNRMKEILQKEGSK